PLAAVGEEPGQEENEEQLPELRGLEAEEAEVDPALRATRDGAAEEDDRHQAEGARVDRALVALVDGRVDQDGSDKRDQADGDEDALADDVVVRVSGDIATGHPG